MLFFAIFLSEFDYFTWCAIQKPGLWKAFFKLHLWMEYQLWTIPINRFRERFRTKSVECHPPCSSMRFKHPPYNTFSDVYLFSEKPPIVHTCIRGHRRPLFRGPCQDLSRPVQCLGTVAASLAVFVGRGFQTGAAQTKSRPGVPNAHILTTSHHLSGVGFQPNHRVPHPGLNCRVCTSGGACGSVPNVLQHGR